MISWLKKKQQNTIDPQVSVSCDPVLEEKPLESKPDFFSRFKQGLSKTRQQLGKGIRQIFSGSNGLDAQVSADLEDLLLSADLGIATTQSILNNLKTELQQQNASDSGLIISLLKKQLIESLAPSAQALNLDLATKSPFVILMVGVNGAGKTTTIGKLAQMFQKQGKSVILAAGDTFRAAAVEQLQAWGERNQTTVIAQQTGADSASVIFDAFQAAKARGFDVLIADTAGRLHTQDNLMAELKKVKRVLQKIDPAAPHEVMLVLDASIGQNALNQTREFHQAIGVTGITMTKLDGTAKGGILFALAHEFGLPFRYIGLGEGIDDLQVFDAPTFVEAILDEL